MPVLLFSDDFSPSERRVYARVFSLTCRGLGIEKIDASVMMVKEDFSDTRLKGAVRCLTKDLFQLQVNSRNGEVEGTYAMVHETVHIKQFVTGQMSDHFFGVIWEGTFFPAEVSESPEYYERLPWEREAHSRTPALHLAAMNLLDDTDKKRLVRELDTITFSQETQYA